MRDEFIVPSRQVSVNLESISQLAGIFRRRATTKTPAVSGLSITSHYLSQSPTHLMNKDVVKMSLMLQRRRNCFALGLFD